MAQGHHQGYWRPRGNCWGRGSTRSNSYNGPSRTSDESTPELDDEDYLKVHCSSLHRGGPRSLEPPRVLGSYSVDDESNVHFDDTMMCVLSDKYMPKDNKSMQVELDLNKGWHQVNGFTGSAGVTFKQILQWILKNQKKLTSEDPSNKLADFVCQRGVLKNVMKAPYANHKFCDMTVLAQYFEGSVYLAYQQCDEEENYKEKEKMSLTEIFGYKFQQYMTGGDPDEVLECNCQYRCVLKGQLNEMSLLYAVNTHAVDQTLHTPDFKDMSSFVTMRLCKERFGSHKEWNYRKYTLNRWWIENQLTGVPRLLKGTRDNDGILHTVEMLQTNDLPDMAKGDWEPSVCINFLVKFLNFVKEKVVSEPHQVHCFERSTSEPFYFTHSHDTSGTEFLPKWYTHQLFEDENSD